MHGNAAGWLPGSDRRRQAARRARLTRLATAAVMLASAGPFNSCRRPGDSKAAPAPVATPRPAAAPAAAETSAPRGKQLVIVYSSNILGEYEPCG